MKDQKLYQLLKNTYAFFQKELDDFSIQVWRNSLAEYSYEEISEAFLLALRECEFLPMPARILKLIEKPVVVEVPKSSFRPLPAPVKKDGSYMSFDDWRAKNNKKLSTEGEKWAKCLDFKELEKRTSYPQVSADGGKKVFDELLEECSLLACEENVD